MSFLASKPDQMGISMGFWNHSKSISLLVLFLLLLASTCYAGSIMGTVVNAHDNEPLVAVNVVVPSTSFGSSTDLDGKFKINDLQDGSYNLQITHVGYRDTLVENVQVIDGIANPQQIALHPEGVVLTPVVYRYRRPTDVVSSENRVSGDVAGELSAKAGPFSEITYESTKLTLDILTLGRFTDHRKASQKLREAKLLLPYHLPRSKELFEDVVNNHGERSQVPEALYFLSIYFDSETSKTYANMLLTKFPESPYSAMLLEERSNHGSESRE